MTINWKAEWPLIVEMSDHRAIDPCFIGAIRKAEGGGPGREFGVLSMSVVAYAGQLRVCTKTVAGKLATFLGNPFMMVDVNGLKRLMYTPAFIAYVAASYCPVGADNDPHGLNKNWRTNVQTIYEHFVQLGGPV